MGNRVYKKVEDISDPQNPTIVSEQKLVDISSQLPVILCEIKPSDGSLKKSYIYADAQVLCQRYHDPVDPNFYDASYYVHDRLGSVRLVVVPEYDQQQQTWAVRAANSYTYTPFGSFYDGQCIENIANPFKFTGQWHDVEIDQYHLRARQYDPAMMRFTSRDPVIGERTEPLTLHQYLYCINDPANRTDISGEMSLSVGNGLKWATEVRAAGIMVAAYGADIGDFDMIIAGAFIQQLSPLAYMIGQATSGVCFVAGTEVLTPIGNVPIEQIQAGWLVWGLDPKTGKPSVFEVVQCFQRETNELVRITIGEEEIWTTKEHPFYVYEKGWCEAGELKAGTKIINFEGQPVKISTIEYINKPETVYNIEVSESHTYYVSQENLLVHNECGLGRILQGPGDGGKILPGTAKALGKHKGSIKNAVESLKKVEGYANNYHGYITDTGAYLTKAKTLIGWLDL